MSWFPEMISSQKPCRYGVNHAGIWRSPSRQEPPMPAFPFVTLDVFTDHRFGGNPLAVFTDARGLTDAQMQSLAAEMNLSETTFVLPPEDPAHTARVRIFNRTAEMPFAGHPSVPLSPLINPKAVRRAGSWLLIQLEPQLLAPVHPGPEALTSGRTASPASA